VKLNECFHERAIMNGYLGDQLLLATPELFIAEICKSPMKETGFDYSPIVSELNIDDNVASVTLVESYPDGMGFTNYFHLINDGNGWKIISKTFMGHKN